MFIYKKLTYKLLSFITGNTQSYETTNSISSLRKLTKNEIQQPNNYKRYLKIDPKKIENFKQLCVKTSMDRRALCKNRFRTNILICSIRIKQTQERNFENICIKTRMINSLQTIFLKAYKRKVKSLYLLNLRLFLSISHWSLVL